METLDRLNATFQAQREAVLADPLPTLDTRLDRIGRVRRMQTASEEIIRTAMQSDFGSLHASMVVMLDTFPFIDRVAQS